MLRGCSHGSFPSRVLTEQDLDEGYDYLAGRIRASLQLAFDQFSNDRESEIEKICNANHQDFVTSVDSMLRIRDQTVQMSGEILQLNESIQESIEKLATQKKALVDSRSVRQNINEATQALNACLNVLRIANQVQDMTSCKPSILKRSAGSRLRI